MSCLVRVSWPEGHGYLTRLPGGGTGIGPRERARRFRHTLDAAEEALTWAERVAEAQHAQGKRRTNHNFTLKSLRGSPADLSAGEERP